MGGLQIECWADFQTSSAMYLMLRKYYMRAHCFSCESKTSKVVLAGSKCIRTHGIAKHCQFLLYSPKIVSFVRTGFFSEIAAMIVSLCKEKTERVWWRFTLRKI
jgi:hypothetical protein